MRKSILTLLLIFTVSILMAQVTDPEGILREQTVDTLKGWSTGGTISISATQTSFTNWAAGGQNSIAVGNIASAYANYSKKKASWDNTLDLGYGILRQGDENGWMKTNDKVDLASKYGQRASERWYYAVLINFKTQMAPGYDYPNDSISISDFLAPGYIIGALGMDYKPSRHFSAFIAPLTSKTTIVNNQRLADAGAFGVEEGEKIRNQFGGYVRLSYQKNNIIENVNLTTKIDLFSDYLDKPQNLDVNWEVLLSMKVGRYLTVTFSTQLLYDDDIKIGIDTNDDGTFDKFGPRTQYKQVVGVGLSYSFTSND